MIATGGLLRITARRQDSLKSRAHKAHKSKKSKHKRRAEVVVVKAKLKLASVSGLVAALGVLVLLVGMAMAALGYWPRHGLFVRAASRGAAGAQEAPDRDAGWSPGGVNGSRQQGPGLLTDVLNRYLHSDRLKVLGPLVMGVGIFLFICANAVLHETRDQKTRVIRLRDIYSTVIDLHSRHAAAAAPQPLHGLVNYVQSRGLEPRSRCYPAFLLGRAEGAGGGGGVFSVHKPGVPGPSTFSSPPPATRGPRPQLGGATSSPPARPRSSSSSCSASRLLLPSLSVSASRRCSLPAVAAATLGHRRSCEPAEMTSRLWGRAEQSLTL